VRVFAIASAALVVAAGALLVFVVPWHVPASGPVWSLSWPFGFSNAAAIAGFGATLALALARQWVLTRGGPALPDGFVPVRDRPATGSAAEGRPRADPFALAVVASCCAAIGALWLWIPFPIWGEARYFLARMDLAALGLEPYRDFRFSYGPLLLHAPPALAAATGGALSVAGAYGVLLVLSWAAGLLAMHAVVVRSGLPRTEGRVVFVLVAVLFLNVTLGFNYSPLRFAAPLAGAVHLDAAVAGGRLSAARLALRAGAWTAGAWLVSPEIGLIATVVLCVQTAAHAAAGRRAVAWVALAPPVAAAAVVAATGGAYMDSVRTFASGANAFPVLPTPQVVALCAFALGVLPCLAAGALRDPERRPLLVALLLGAGLPLAGAFSRCDAGHVLFYGWGACVLGLALLRRAGVLPFAAGVLVFAAAFAPNQLLSESAPLVEALRDPVRYRRWLAARPELADRWRAEWEALGPSPLAIGPGDAGKIVGFPREASALATLPPVGTPLGAPPEIDRYLKATGRWIPEYHPAPHYEAYTPADVERKLADLGAMPLVLVPDDVEERVADAAPGAWAAQASRFLSATLSWPVELTQRNPPLEPDRIVARRLVRDFETVGRIGPMRLMRRHDPP